ncbi:MAG: PmoA family protein [Bacteroidales bacterium]|jgi:hypothetical protein|nr:PmoA family protein [Bacteroidales bacterium]
MKKISLWMAVLSMSWSTAYGQRITLVPDKTAHKVEVRFSGMLFTSYLYPDSFTKPVLYPLYNSNGTCLTRGFPLAPNAGERIDHPHHSGIWFNYGNVNGLDFWNSSYSDLRKAPYGFIRHTGITCAESGDNKAVLTVTADWNDASGKTLLKAETEYVFAGEGHIRTVEHTVRLTAQDAPVVFADSKEGLFGIRLDKSFEEPSDEPVIRLGYDGKPMATPVADGDGADGKYRNAQGQEGEANTWGKRSEWMMVSANKEGDESTLAILDHHQNIGFPAHWHARGYGLFAANNLGSNKYSLSDPESSFTLRPGESVTFKHKIVIKAGSFATDEDIKEEYNIFNR